MTTTAALLLNNANLVVQVHVAACLLTYTAVIALALLRRRWWLLLCSTAIFAGMTWLVYSYVDLFSVLVPHSPLRTTKTIGQFELSLHAASMVFILHAMADTVRTTQNRCCYHLLRLVFYAALVADMLGMLQWFPMSMYWQQWLLVWFGVQRLYVLCVGT